MRGLPVNILLKVFLYVRQTQHEILQDSTQIEEFCMLAIYSKSLCVHLSHRIDSCICCSLCAIVRLNKFGASCDTHQKHGQGREQGLLALSITW